jgi:hypothetical protein
MKKFFLISLLFLFTVGVLTAQEDTEKLLKDAGCAADFPSASHLIVYDKTNVKVMDSGLSYVTKEILYKVLTPEGAKKLKSLFFGYDPLTAFVEVKGAKIIRKSGKTIDIPLDSVVDYPAPARAIYWGAREILLPVGLLEPGDGLWVQTEQKGFTYALLYDEEDNRYIPPMKGHFYDIVPFYSSIPINIKSYEVSIPSNKRFQYHFYNGEAFHYAHVDGDRTIYFWKKKNIGPIEEEHSMVNESDFAPKLLMSTSPNWEAKSLWFYKVNEDYGSFEFDDEIKKKAEEIIRGARDDMEKISRLTHWVAEEVRYSGLSMGEGEGFTLHKGTMTFRDRCGVCKDKAGMLITMLRAAGFESYPAMTMAGSRIDRIPADQFNHSVTIVKLNGEYKLLDPTWVPGTRELWSSAEQQQEYLMGVPEGADLKSTPISPPENHYIKFKIDTRISPQGHLTADFQVFAEGQSDSRLRRSIKGTLKEAWEHFFQEEFHSIHPRIKMSKLSYLDPYDISKPMKITFTVEIENYVDTANGTQETCFSPLSSNLPFREALFYDALKPFPEKRMYPFRTRSSQSLEVDETIKLPSGFKLLDPGKLENVDGTGASFTGDIQQKGNSVVIRKKLQLKKRLYEPEEWKHVRESILEFNKPDGGILVVTRN